MKNIYILIFTGLVIAGIFAVFGLYALSGAGYIRRLPWLKPMLVIISGIYTLRGLLLIPELLVMIGVFQISIPVALKFIVFSLVALLIGLVYTTGTIGGWHSLSSTNK